MINSLTNGADIANIFATKYSDLCKSVPTSVSEIAALRDTVTRDIACVDSSHLTGRVSVDDFVKTLYMLKKGKSDGLRWADSHQFIQCNNGLNVYISLIITSISTHG